MTYRDETESLRREVESLKKELHNTQANWKSWAEPTLKLRNFSAVMIAINAVVSIIGIAYSAIFFFEKDPQGAAFMILGAIFSMLWCVTTLAGEISAAYRSREE